MSLRAFEQTVEACRIASSSEALQEVVSSYVSTLSESVRLQLAETSSSSAGFDTSAVVISFLSGEQVMADVSEAKSILDVRYVVAGKLGLIPPRVKLMHGGTGGILRDEQDLSCLAPDGHVTVVLRPKTLFTLCRIRPLSSREKHQEANVIVYALDKKKADVRMSNGSIETYEFDACSNCGSQENIFEFCNAVVPLALQGEHACVIAYGQTGAGKTHTMYGPKVQAKADTLEGIVPRIARAIFEHPGLQGREVKLSMMEDYRDRLTDLLLDDTSPRGAEIQVRFNKDHLVRCEHLTEILCLSAEDMCEQIIKAITRRQVAMPMMSVVSSRSSLICQISIRSYNEEKDQSKEGRLVLVDPAGSERLKAAATGHTLKETACINRGHAALCNVLQAYAKGEKFIPYRDSKLTMLLRDCLANAFVIVACSPVDTNEDETVSSLRFAQRIMS